MARITFVWENLGPMHFDRLEAIVEDGHEVMAIQFVPRSEVYSWKERTHANFKMKTLFETGHRVTELSLGVRLTKKLFAYPSEHIFFCHYERIGVFFAACIQRIFTRKKLYLMNNSKFDDYPRSINRDILKRILFLPYQKVITSSERAANYLQYIKFADQKIARGYNTLSIKRLKSQVESDPQDIAFRHRPFIIVSRLVEKKNIITAIDAFAQFVTRHGQVRKLLILGDGPLENELRAHTNALGLNHLVEFLGFLQTEQVTTLMSRSLALILPSIEEQYGFVIIEAFAVKLPVLCSINAGAIDGLVDNAVNGFIIDPKNSDTITEAMSLIHKNQSLYQRFSSNAAEAAQRGDVQHFVSGVNYLIQCT